MKQFNTKGLQEQTWLGGGGVPLGIMQEIEISWYFMI